MIVFPLVSDRRLIEGFNSILIREVKRQEHWLWNRCTLGLFSPEGDTIIISLKTESLHPKFLPVRQETSRKDLSARLVLPQSYQVFVDEDALIPKRRSCHADLLTFPTRQKSILKFRCTNQREPMEHGVVGVVGFEFPIVVIPLVRSISILLKC